LTSGSADVKRRLTITLIQYIETNFYTLTDALKQMECFPVIEYDPSAHRLISLDLTAANPRLNAAVVADTGRFTDFISQELASRYADFGIGGYGEHRTVYSRSSVFDGEANGDEPRRLHLGTDIWGPVDTAVYAPLDGVIHSFAFNNQYGDYGATIILTHEAGGQTFQTLYGHLSLKDLDGLETGRKIKKGNKIAHFGPPEENGHWPPHLHFQIILDLGRRFGDYPGVCKYSEQEQWLKNSPDPDGILKMNRFIEL
jgi:murein DD-endopeptidase MepM/ murein hydrolase activator NlpD